ncbi:hypothetical protein OHA70_07870 [Kribbella sp. NBC_00382]|uniref:hypothetical protein n=1 Tax=Kribbella sp. NBC_00382 TaxID=2975967 RepID=UPI002E1D134E
MKSLRSSSMIAAAMSVVRPANRRRAGARSAARTATDHQLGVVEPPSTRGGSDAPSELNSIADRTAPMSYSLIGW